MRDVLSEKATEGVKRVEADYGARNVRVLDSVQSDSADNVGLLVFLVDMDEGRSLFDLVALTEELREALGVVVNVLTEGSISPYLCDAILAEANRSRSHSGRINAAIAAPKPRSPSLRNRGSVLPVTTRCRGASVRAELLP
jgi:uncharacterized protein